MNNPILNLYRLSYVYSEAAQPGEGGPRSVDASVTIACCGGWRAISDVAEAFIEVMRAELGNDTRLIKVELFDSALAVLPSELKAIRERDKNSDWDVDFVQLHMGASDEDCEGNSEEA